MPLGMPAHDVGVEAGGGCDSGMASLRLPNHLRQCVPEGDLHYSALIGPDKRYGTVAFLDDIPKVILDLIRTMYT